MNCTFPSLTMAFRMESIFSPYFSPAAQPFPCGFSFCHLSEGEAEGVRGDIAFAQSCIETGNFTFSGPDCPAESVHGVAHAKLCPEMLRVTVVAGNHSVGCPQPKASAFISSWNSPAHDTSCVHAFIDGDDGTVYPSLWLMMTPSVNGLRLYFIQSMANSSTATP